MFRCALAVAQPEISNVNLPGRPSPRLLGRAAFAGNTDHRSKASLHVLFCCRPGRDANAHRCLALPDRACAPASAILLDASYHFAGHVRATKGHQHLIDHHIVQHGESCLPQAFRKTAAREHTSARSARTTLSGPAILATPIIPPLARASMYPACDASVRGANLVRDR